MVPAEAIAKLDHLLDEDPGHPDLAEVLSVAGDRLQEEGQLRGQLIALELLLDAATNDESRASAAATLESFIASHEARLFGSLHMLRHRRGALRQWVHGGRIEGLFIDARRISPDPRYRLEAKELVQILLGSPAIRHLRRLQIRTARIEGSGGLLEQLGKQAKLGALEIEQLIISPTTRPIGHRVQWSLPSFEVLRRALPKLWFATHAGDLVSLLDPKSPDEASALELDRMRGQAMARDLRIWIGRGLSSGRPETTKVACERIVEHGESSRVFLPALRMLLRPKVSPAAAWIIPAIPHFGTWARELAPQLRAITGSAGIYPIEQRRAAGKVLARIREDR